MYLTYKFRLKNPNLKRLNEMAGRVNFVWNYANDTSIQYLDKFSRWLSFFDLVRLTSGCGSQLGLSAKTIEAVVHEYAARRKQFKKRKLSWRSKKRSLGWLPFAGESIKVTGDQVRYNKHVFKFWRCRDIPGEIKSGCFTQDSKGNWYVSLVCKVPTRVNCYTGRSVGIDLGLKTLATLSDSREISRENLTSKYAARLATAQRARKPRQVKSIHRKIANVRRDWNHKQTTQLINSYDQIFVGDVSPSKLKRTHMAKSVSDAGWANFKTMLAYKAIALGVEYHEVKEKFSTVTCSACSERTGPSGLSALGVREWTCECGATHNRDVNAANNILRFGRESLIKGNPDLGGRQADLSPIQIKTT